MLGVLRIRGEIDIRKPIEDTLQMLGLKRKYSFTVIDENNPAQMGMVKKVKDFVTFGEIDEALAKKILGDKKYRGMHPPRGGFKYGIKQSGSKGELGKRTDMAELLERML